MTSLPGVWADLVGQDDVVSVLQRAAAAADPRQPETNMGMTHAWLITGPPGSGRSTAARAFAAALQCSAGGCGGCDACRTAISGTHADVEIINTRRLSIGVDDVRGLVSRAARHPSGGRWQVMVVEDADRLTDQAGNALLKAIEEPTPHAVWLLCAPSSDDVLLTVRSRCRHLSLRTPSTAAVTEVLMRRDGIDEAIASFAARVAQGHIGRARRLATDEHARMRRNQVLQLPQQLGGLGIAMRAAGDLVAAANAEADEQAATTASTEAEEMRRALGVGAGSRSPSGSAAALKELEAEQKKRATRTKRDSIDRALIDLAGFYRDVLAVQAGASVVLVNDEMRAAITTLATTSTAESTLRRIDAILAARTAIDANVAPLLAVEAMTVALGRD